MTAYAPEAHTRRPRLNVWLVSVIVLAAGLAAVGLGVVIDRSTGSEADATTIIDELSAAATAGDIETIANLHAAGAVFVMAGGQRVVGRADVVNMTMAPSSIGLELERVSPVASWRDFAATFVGYSNGAEGIKLVVFQFRDGKIVRHWDFEPALTPPLDNAVWP